MQVDFNGRTCRLSFGRYGNHRPALSLVDPTTGEREATCTVNIPELELASDEILVKDYSENSGMLKALESAGVVKPTGRCVQSGYVQIPVCKLRVRPGARS